MNGWYRLFTVIAICWALAAPFLVMSGVNEPTHRTFD